LSSGLRPAVTYPGPEKKGQPVAPPKDTAYIVFDTESVVDGALLARVLYRDGNLSPEEAIERYRCDEEETGGVRSGFIPVSFHVPVAIAVARIGADFRILDVACLDAPRFDPRAMVELFWRGVQLYGGAVLVDFNGRGFDIPLLTLSAFRFGISCPRYFDDPERYGFRYRFTSKHLDLMEWLTEYGACRLRGGLDLLAKVLGKPGKTETSGSQVEDLYRRGRLQEINDYCLQDVLDTYFVFLRTRVLAGKLRLEAEQALVEEAKEWLEARSASMPALGSYLKAFGAWDPTPFR
jgi:predicted PolB exonuclease-like 3'-5' exonuclease